MTSTILATHNKLIRAGSFRPNHLLISMTTTTTNTKALGEKKQLFKINVRFNFTGLVSQA